MRVLTALKIFWQTQQEKNSRTISAVTSMQRGMMIPKASLIITMSEAIRLKIKTILATNQIATKSQ